MSSDGQRTQRIRTRKRTKMGQERRAKLRNQGTTKKQKELFGDE